MPERNIESGPPSPEARPAMPLREKGEMSRMKKEIYGPKTATIIEVLKVLKDEEGRLKDKKNCVAALGLLGELEDSHPSAFEFTFDSEKIEKLKPHMYADGYGSFNPYNIGEIRKQLQLAIDVFS